MTLPLWFHSIPEGEDPRPDPSFGRRVRIVPNAGSLPGEPHPLVERIRNGDTSAFSQLVDDTLDEAIRVAAYVLGNHDAAKDVVQDALIRLWERRTTLDSSRPVVPYLMAAVRNRALDQVKARRVRERYRERIAREGVAEANDGEDSILTTAFDDAMRALPERQRTAVQLRYREQKTYADIGAILDVSANAAHQLVVRAVRTLRDRLGIVT